jgi:hypothetical protein
MCRQIEISARISVSACFAVQVDKVNYTLKTLDFCKTTGIACNTENIGKGKL